MKKIFCLFILAALAVFAHGSSLVKASIGLKPGMNITTYNPDDDLKNYSGVGFNIGFGLGVDVGNIGVELAPSYRNTNYGRTIHTILGDVSNSWHYNNFYLPVHFLLKTNEIGAVAPYLGLGFAMDFQTDGYTVINNGNPIDVAEADLQNDFFLSFSLGADINQDHFKVAPEFTFDYNLTPEIWETENQTESNFDFTISLGLYFVP
jgi:Outer membrane protein beta-barrel domain